MREIRSQAEQHKQQASALTVRQGGQEVGWGIEAFLHEGHAGKKGQRAEDGTTPLCYCPQLFDLCANEAIGVIISGVWLHHTAV
jgi:hypothetical protein